MSLHFNGLIAIIKMTAFLCEGLESPLSCKYLIKLLLKGNSEINLLQSGISSEAVAKQNKAF